MKRRLKEKHFGFNRSYPHGSESRAAPQSIFLQTMETLQIGQNKNNQRKEATAILLFESLCCCTSQRHQTAPSGEEFLLDLLASCNSGVKKQSKKKKNFIEFYIVFRCSRIQVRHSFFFGRCFTLGPLKCKVHHYGDLHNWL